MPATPIRLVGQFLFYAAFAWALGYLSTAPAYRACADDTAQIKLSFSHAAEHRGTCRRLSPDEIAALAPNMRRPLDCPRGRLDVVVELTVDERQIFSASLPPSGLAGDGEATVYRKFTVPAGAHAVAVRLRDSARDSGFDYAREERVQLAAGQNFVIDFAAANGGFLFR